ncbi:MAG: YtxH domain-containing protein [Candidatus Saccharibacteria bacterium]|nr:YtxH domain-containing protein [Candidatus Saccharibacteria bacterium]
MKKVIAAVGAIAAGFAAGVLLAPKSGKETRQDLKRKVAELKKKADKTAKQAKAAAKDSLGALKTGAQKVGDVAAETARDVKGNVEKRFK